jgi:hypothetical protein
VLAFSLVSACSVDFRDTILELRSDSSGYGTNITAEDYDNVTIRLKFEIEDVYGSNCAQYIKANAKIYRQDEDGYWSEFKTISTKSEKLEENYYTFTWKDIFRVDDRYTKYRVNAEIFDNKDQEYENLRAYVELKNNNSSNSDYDYKPTTYCEDLSIIANDIEINENSEQNTIFYLKNDSTKRFEITEIKITSNGLTLNNYYNEKYASANGIANIIVKAKADNVFSNQTYENNISVRGTFSDGKTCSFSNIQRKTFNVNIRNNDSISATFNNTPNCNNFSIIAQDYVQIENFGKIPISITNGTNQRADVYIEGTIESTPSLISLPANSAITRDIDIKTYLGSGEITLRPIVSGCNFSSKTIKITNTARGSITQLSMNTKFEENETQGNIIIQVTNPTTRIFNGIVKISAPNGWSANTKEVTITPGTNNIVIPLTKTTNAINGAGKVSLIVEDEEINNEFSVTGGNTTRSLAGLFTLGIFGINNLANLLILIIVVILIIGMIGRITSDEKNEKTQAWEEKNN